MMVASSISRMLKPLSLLRRFAVDGIPVSLLLSLN
jgi:hypothetical protein